MLSCCHWNAITFNRKKHLGVVWKEQMIRSAVSGLSCRWGQRAPRVPSPTWRSLSSAASQPPRPTSPPSSRRRRSPSWSAPTWRTLCTPTMRKCHGCAHTLTHTDRRCMQECLCVCYCLNRMFWSLVCLREKHEENHRPAFHKVNRRDELLSSKGTNFVLLCRNYSIRNQSK